MPDLTKLEAAKQLALNAAPYLRDAIAAVEWVVIDFPYTMGCDKYWRVYVDKTALTELPVRELAWIVLHEVGGHLVRSHHSQSVDGYSAMQVNVAQDLEIESWEWNCNFVERPDWGLHPSKFNLPVGEVWQYYLDKLPDNLPDTDCGSGATGPRRDWELGPSETCVMPDSMREKVIQGKVAVAIKSQGSGCPAGLSIWADKHLEPPRVDWRSIFRRVVSHKMSCGMLDMIGPGREKRGLLYKRWRGEQAEIAIVADTSGSMYSEGGIVLGACMDIIKTTGSGVDVCWIDEEPTWQLSVKAKKDLRPVGGGGTDLSPAIINAQGKNYDLIVVITDCMTPWPDSSKNCLVLCVGDHKPPRKWRHITCPST